ncbi:hypothetical protein SAMN05444392_11058 [Seinonella peptonophila]|uniref:Uncharacterized protein n=1 Tax=Seinonella peptonophila TaxID=112248 RepID=A0A1M4ZQI5_9BACL|nr:hypothetical protein [Seinonella peptonophila]SHF20281.1 hypothetical protein SAMN05444392_11058 [Seinonella peptonophila]
MVGTAIVGGAFSIFFNKKLESYKFILNKQLETYKQEWQVKFHSTSLYLSKKQEVYAKMYSKITITVGNIFDLRRYPDVKSFQDFSEKDLMEYIKEYVTDGVGKDIQRVFNEGDKEKAERLFSIAKKQTMYSIAYQSICGCNNFFLENELFFSKETIELISTINSYLKKLHSNYYPEYYQHPDSGIDQRILREENDSYKEILIKSVDELKTLMREELS